MKKIHIIFVCLVLAVLVTGLARTVLFPKEINTYENRYAQRLPSFSAEGYGDGTFQDGVDQALMDQIPLAQSMKSLYNRGTTWFLKGALGEVMEMRGLNSMRYVDFNGMRLFGEYIAYWPRYLPSVQTELDKKIAVLNKTFSDHPELTFYTYYIEKDTDLNFETQEKTGVSDYLLQRLQLPEENKGIFSVDSFHQFAQEFYQTDAHWNYQGSYQGYCQLVDLLGCVGEPLRPEGSAVQISDSFSGKKAASVAGERIFTEVFYAYSYHFPNMTVTIDGAPAQDYGEQTAYLSGQADEPVSYGGFYGGDNGESILATGTRDRGKILVIGESFDNAVLKLLASHYDALYSIDLRYYEHSMKRPFDLSSYTKDNGIDTVLLIGNLDYFIQDTFDPEG